MNIKSRLKKMRIGVIYGGRSAEREISLLTGKAVLKSLLSMGFKASGIDAGADLPFLLKKNRIDFAYIALHGQWGEDGTVQGLLEIMGIPYSGCGVASSALAMDKIYSKMIFDSVGLPTPEWRVFDGAAGNCKFPCVVKPASQGSAIGVSVVGSRKDFIPAIKRALKYDKRVIIEKFVSGTEITVGVLGGKALPVIEIVPENKFYDFESKYKPGMSTHIMPPRLPSKAVKLSQELAVRAFNALGCRAVSRIDFIVDKNNKPWLLEINTIPGMTETSLLPDAARASGLGFGELVLKIIEYSL